jgi:hypothetical protein
MSFFNSSVPRFKPSRKHLALQLKYLRLQEDFDNINRAKPVRLNVAGSAKLKKKQQSGVIDPGYISIPTEAEMDFYTSGITAAG